MSKTIKLKKGFDIKLVGKAEKQLADFAPAKTFAIKPTDFVGMQRPKVTVSEGDTVKAGTPILIDKAFENVCYVAPVSGEVIEIKRGDKRKLLEIKILADKEISYETFDKFSVSFQRRCGSPNVQRWCLAAVDPKAFWCGSQSGRCSKGYLYFRF